MADLEWYQSRGKEKVEVKATDSLAIPRNHSVQEASASATQPITPMEVDLPVLVASSPKSTNLARASVASSEAHSVFSGDSLQEAMRVTEELLSDMPEVDHESITGGSEQASAFIPMQSPREGFTKPTASLEVMKHGVVSDTSIPCGVSTDVSHPHCRS
jgi:hypothetical protein